SMAVQVKGLSDVAAAKIGTSLDRVTADFWIVVTNLRGDGTEAVSYVLTRAEVLALAKRDEGGKQNYWLDAVRYRSEAFRGRWDRLPSRVALEGAWSPVE